ncbi:class I SAM-dependent methyltransferase [Thioflexithrix psekupsensis]|uniref:Methyltransferase n=1 Tax=Thioflexithrix psekupsensis TaxID=1570016 RepID=A0A251X891_9GAMM|nr:class I SAM-dependent methyltransferase [Thioflexithrix psekupsensis]OUD13947.1 hypothetical protein TPSD3_06280 [Thioflexithrix psekupsensis]
MLDKTLNALKAYTPPEGWGGHIFLLPEQAMRDIYHFILDNKLTSCIELGTGFGATSCVILSALEKQQAGKLLTLDKAIHQPVNVNVLREHAGLPGERLHAVGDVLGYNWYLAELLQQQRTAQGYEPLFDFCLLDGAHEWEPDALAFHLIAPLMKPNSWILIDDLNFNLRMIPNWRESHGSHTDKELDAFQMKMVYDLVVTQHPDFTDFKITHDDRIGWARKKPAPSFWKKWMGCS